MAFFRSIHHVLFALLLACSSSYADEVNLLLNRLQAQSVREQMIMQETKSLRLSTYLFDLDDFGKKTVGLLVDAAHRGVKVTMIVDGIGKGVTYHAGIVEVLKRHGIEVLVYHPKVRDLIEINNRNHMKALIGSEAVITGDRNMTSSYFKRKSPTNYISAEIMVKGENAQKAAEAFDAVKNSESVARPIGFVSEESIQKTALEIHEWTKLAKSQHVIPGTPFKTTTNDVKYIADPPMRLDKSKIGVHQSLLEMIREAKSTLEIANPYVLLTPEFKTAISDAIARGVKVKIFSNSSAANDVYLMGVAWDARKQDLIKMGIDVYELKAGQFLHAKTMIVDTEKIYIGSFNMDPRSQNLNLENGVIVSDKKLAEKLSVHNRRIEKYFMVQVTPFDPKTLPLKERYIHCTKQGLRRFITKAFEPSL